MEFDFYGTESHVKHMEEVLFEKLSLLSIMDVGRSYFFDENGGSLDKKMSLDPNIRKIRRTSGPYVRIWTRLPRNIVEKIWKPEEASKVKFKPSTGEFSGEMVTESFKKYDYPRIFSPENNHLAREFAIIALIRSNSNHPQIFNGFQIRYAFEMM